MDNSQTPNQQSETRQTKTDKNQQIADLVIVSIYGRGNWLATELVQKGWKVTLIDVSERMGPWSPTDSEGPFGLFEISDLKPSQIKRYSLEGEKVEVPQGFTIWLPSGPIDFRSQMTPYLFEKWRERGLSEFVERYLWQTLADRELDRERKAILKQPFTRVWPLHFSHQFSANKIRENHSAGEFGMATPFFAEFSIRRTTQAGYDAALKACRASGVTVRARASVKDLRLNERLVDALEVADERSGIERGRAFTWMLTSAETEKLAPHIKDVLFPRGVVRPEWFWARYEFDIQSNLQPDQLPKHFVVLDDPLLPWTNENLMVVRKKSDQNASLLDVWVRLPAWTRFNLNYLEQAGERMAQVFRARVPKCDPVVTSLPLEARVEEAKLGPPRFPIFKSEDLQKLSVLKTANLFFDSPEFGESLDALGEFRRQSLLFAQLERLKSQWDAATLRLEGAPRSPTP